MQQGGQLSPLLSLHHHPYGSAGQAQNLAHGGDGSYGVEVLLLGRFHREVTLGDQKDLLPGGHGLVQGLDGSLPAHVEMQQHAWEYGETPQGKGGDYNVTVWLH
ncbi:hypothetical protein SDC9_193746 [bioreactor metagenome]|uniref:Uncharacterized protein n=1 Tax=bioreactor metagenome TaxID=1076179 RepID=A0A645IFL5_9ZZZZ